METTGGYRDFIGFLGFHFLGYWKRMETTI